MSGSVEGFAAAALLRSKGFGDPHVAVILGSGLGELARRLEQPLVCPYHEIPGFARTTVSGHAGQLVQGYLQGKKVLAMQGRFHYYEGHSQQQIAHAVRVMRQLGAGRLIVTNAAGGLNRDFSVGDLMLITDHINMTGDNPLRGKNDDKLGPRFPDMSQAYSRELTDKATESARWLGSKLRRGVYLAVSGPSYETPAEIQCFARLGADAVGMSTVPEVITAVHCGMKVLGISCITNMAAGLGAEKLDHNEVIEVTRRVREDFEALVTRIIATLGEEVE